MKKTILGFISILFLISCAVGTQPLHALYHSYTLYNESLNENNINDDAKLYFTQSLLGDDYATNPDASSQLLFKNYMHSVVNHFEEINNNNGCLTINGYGKDKAPVIFSLKYKKNMGNWLIDKIHVVFIENIKDFSKKAKCPEAFENKNANK
ncbi:MAG: hypothetical protein OQK98_01845 [Gammaproteobacteria bacterium]|nr:hypothetical protein [Gammaproteobacteria bacterium]